ncbi:hypothetical protein Y1Q_0006840 [Alligator mississippiensis]|uniref:Uncharacterized protein n=1 Tax=Alligator mississippiensis TaxID=8496 RepID=A0A151M5T9_ALLMI|nr:hypothetical protein Y1Q_0006840 [Alligator mississippiensis]
MAAVPLLKWISLLLIIQALSPLGRLAMSSPLPDPDSSEEHNEPPKPEIPSSVDPSEADSSSPPMPGIPVAPWPPLPVDNIPEEPHTEPPQAD